MRKIRGAKILLVEDDVINQIVATEMLELIGIDVEIASTGQEALTKIDRQRFDLVLMDIQLPDIDGWEITRRVRVLKSNVELPIVAMTANAKSSDIKRSLDAGMNDHLLKPVVAEYLYRTMIKWLKPQTDSELNARLLLQSVRSTEPGIDFNKLAGVDLEVGLKRLGGKPVAFRNVLERFYQEYRNVFETVENAWFNKDFDKVAKIAHNLKGTAGNIGAVNLQAAALQLENVLINAGTGKPRDSLNNFESELALIINSLENFFAQDVSNNTMVTSGIKVQPQLAELLISLANEVATSQPKPCRRIIAEINALMMPDEVARKVDSIRLAVSMFDFIDAGKILKQLLSELERTYEETAS